MATITSVITSQSITRDGSLQQFGSTQLQAGTQLGYFELKVTLAGQKGVVLGELLWNMISDNLSGGSWSSVEPQAGRLEIVIPTSSVGSEIYFRTEVLSMPGSVYAHYVIRPVNDSGPNYTVTLKLIEL